MGFLKVLLIVVFSTVVGTGIVYMASDNGDMKLIKTPAAATPVGEVVEKVIDTCHVENLELGIVKGEIVYTATKNENGFTSTEANGGCLLDEQLDGAVQRGVKILYKN